eukprot:6044950-Prorocentrum_lima.AAC.1
METRRSRGTRRESSPQRGFSVTDSLALDEASQRRCIYPACQRDEAWSGCDGHGPVLSSCR